MARESPNLKIEVSELRLTNSGKVKAYADVCLDGIWTINDWRIVQDQGQRAWVSVPQTSWKDREGKVRYRALLSIPGETRQKIEIAILSAWEQEKTKHEHSTK